MQANSLLGTVKQWSYQQQLSPTGYCMFQKSFWVILCGSRVSGLYKVSRYFYLYQPCQIAFQLPTSGSITQKNKGKSLGFISFDRPFHFDRVFGSRGPKKTIFLFSFLSNQQFQCSIDTQASTRNYRLLFSRHFWPLLLN